MNVIHSGFDGLDLALKAQAPDDLIKALTNAQETAARFRFDCPIDHNGVEITVAENGGRGGYAFRFSTGPDGATWFAKVPKAGDP